MRERLIQEDYLDDPWKMLVCCILLNQTSNVQVRRVLSSLFDLIPDASVCVNTDTIEISNLIRSTGFYNIKAKRIQDMSKSWILDKTINDLPGIGKYAKDSWEIFINKNLDINPTDKKLLAYLNNRL
jgi:methyl-CpG-binding domain protein 4